MENFSRDAKNGGRSLRAGKRSESDKRWTLLFIGNHGKTITLKRFKGMVLLTCLVLCISIAITVGLLYLSLNIRHEKRQLESDLQDLKAQIKAIRFEKDVLMTKLVLAESRSNAGASPTKAPPKQSEPAAEQQEAGRVEEKPRSPQLANVQKETPVENETPVEAEKSGGEETQPPEAEDQSNQGLSVAIENFKVYPQEDEHVLMVQFKIKNTSPNSRRVSGHAIVVLKGEQYQKDKYLAIPSMSLSDGKPTGRRQGYAFGINYFKTMRFKTNLMPSPEIYQSAMVYIFTANGDLIFEQAFPVDLPPANAATTSSAPFKIPASPTAASSSEPATPPAVNTPAKPPAAAQPSTSTVTPPSTNELMNTLKTPAAE